jgi:putative colanic acid biosynthesis glycosyltransferase
MRSPLISVITVVRNDALGFVRTASSVASQTFQDFEWVVVDGASTDGTLEKIKEEGARITCWISEADAGIYDAMNKGVTLAKGDYLVFINSGDALEDGNSLQLVAQRLLQEEPLADVLYAGAQLVFPDGRQVYRPPRSVQSYIWHGLPANHQATYYRRAALPDPPYDLRYRVCGDYFLAATLYRSNGRCAYLNRSIARFEVGGTSYTRRRALFMEPYTIQRDILRRSLGWRLLSFAKRAIATAGFIFLSSRFGLFVRQNVNNLS